MRDWLQPKIGNWLFRSYISRNGKESASALLIETLTWLRRYADRHALDFNAAVVSSRRRGVDKDFEAAGFPREREA